MGVPSFFKWLVEKYPKILSQIPNKNIGRRLVNDDSYDFRFDNFYLDLNGVIHQSCNPPGLKKPSSHGEVI